jgi:hypothetical protein
VALAMLMVAFGLDHAMRRQIVHLNAGRQNWTTGAVLPD